MINEKISTAHESLHDLPMEDSLTGLFSHGFFQLSLARELRRFQRHRTPFSLCFIDIDGFSYFNARRGHIESDRILKEIGRLIRDNLREIDLPAPVWRRSICRDPAGFQY